MLDYLDEWEQKASTKLRKDFKEEIDAFEKALDTLAICINQAMLGQPNTVKKIAIEDYKALDSATIGFFASWILLGEALIRLQAARRLFLCGYLSRALASTRDSLESAMVADICKDDIEQARKWLKGKQVKLTKKQKFHWALNWETWVITQDILNPLGTHPYLSSTFLSSIVQGAILYPNDDKIQWRYKHDGHFVMWRMLLRSLQLLLYIKSVYPDAKAHVIEFDRIISDVKSVSEKELQIPLDELLILKELEKE